MPIFDSNAQPTANSTAVPAAMTTAVPTAVPACRLAAALAAVTVAGPAARLMAGPVGRATAVPIAGSFSRPSARLPGLLAKSPIRLASLLLSVFMLGPVLAANPVAPSDPAAIEAYRRLPYCRLAPDGLRLAQEPCRRPPTRSYTQRRAAPLLPAPGARDDEGREAAASPGSPAIPAAQLHPAPPLVTLRPPSGPALTANSAIAPVAPIAPAAPAVQPLNQCDIAGCRGANGTPYQKGAGNIVLDPAGRMCTRQGQWVHCQ